MILITADEGRPFYTATLSGNSPDNGKPVVKQGRKTTGLQRDSRVTEGGNSVPISTGSSIETNGVRLSAYG